MTTGQRATLIVMVIALGAAIAYAFLPLPSQSFGGERATCGPGDSSESAVFVKLDPHSVETVPFGANLSDNQLAEIRAFESLCQGVANTRLEVTAVAIVATLIVSLTVWVIFDLSRRDVRRAR